jgi:hypothetical protein
MNREEALFRSECQQPIFQSLASVLIGQAVQLHPRPTIVEPRGLRPRVFAPLVLPEMQGSFPVRISAKVTSEYVYNLPRSERSDAGEFADSLVPPFGQGFALFACSESRPAGRRGFLPAHL